MSRALFVALSVLSGCCLAGCGARSGLVVEGARDGAVSDAGVDAAPCTPSLEACNGIDDDCDAAVDEGLGFGAIGGPIIVRDDHQGGDDRCTTCAIAFGPHAVSTSEGIVVAYRMGFDGSHPVPNTFTRLLDDDGHPRMDIHLLFERNVTLGLRMATHPRGAAAVYCGRFGANDTTTSSLLDDVGFLIEERQREPRGRSCGAWEPDTIWSGTHTLFAWTDNSSGPVAGFEVLLDRASEDGVSVASEMLEPNGDGGPRLAVAHGRVVLVVGVRNEPRHSQLAIHPRALDGTRLGDPIYIEPPGGEEASFETSHVVPSSSGFVVHSASRAGRFVTRLDPNGEPLEPVEHVVDGLDFQSGFDDVRPRAGGGALIAGPTSGPGAPEYAVILVNDRGDTVATWPGDPTEGLPAWGSLVEHRGRVFLTYALLSGENQDQIRIRELGCVP